MERCLLKYFVIPYKNELFCSIIARYQAHIGLSSNRLSNTLFGRYPSNFMQVVTLPPGINYFVQNIGDHYSLTKEVIIDNHSLHPAFDYCVASSYDQFERPSYFNYVKRSRGKDFKYCPDCFHHQLQTGEELFWNRLHNIPDIQLCLEHNTLLETWSPIYDLNARKFINPTIVPIAPSNKNESQLLIDVTARTLQAISLKSNRDLLIEKAVQKGVLRQNEKRRIFVKSHESKIIAYLKQLVSMNSDHSRILKNIKLYLSEYKKPITIYHYHIIESYIDSIECEQSKSDRTVKRICLNRKCINRTRISNITERTLKFKRSEVTTYRCEDCGYEFYYKSNNDVSKPIVLDYGHVTLDYIRDNRPSTTLKQIAKELKISTQKIKKMLDTGKTNRSLRDNSELVEQRKLQWLEYLQSDHFTSVGNPPREYKTIYRYLVAYDLGDWLSVVNKSFRASKSGRSYKKIMPDKSEDEVVLELKEFKAKLLKTEPTVRICKGIILSQKKFQYLTLTLLKLLPKVQDFLTNECESMSDYKKRLSAI